MLNEQEREDKKNKVDICLKEYLEIVKNIYKDKLLKVFLFGSYARGDFQEDSDVDIMILLNVPPQNENDDARVLTDKTFDIILDNDLDIQPVIKSIYTFEQWKDVLPFYKNIENEGKLIYGTA